MGLWAFGNALAGSRGPLPDDDRAHAPRLARLRRLRRLLRGDGRHRRELAALRPLAARPLSGRVSLAPLIPIPSSFHAARDRRTRDSRRRRPKQGTALVLYRAPQVPAVVGRWATSELHPRGRAGPDALPEEGARPRAPAPRQERPGCRTAAPSSRTCASSSRSARGYLGYGLPYADLIQEGNIGLMKAVRPSTRRGAPDS